MYTVAKAPVQHRTTIPRERDEIRSFFVTSFMISSIVISNYSVLVKPKVSIWSDSTFLLKVIYVYKIFILRTVHTPQPSS